ncbi:MAG: hypothetical protein KGL39_15155 [Patescibacteria group bacterium]|nr:hypothetical protein [Patescibacteria group bacterium]
MALSSGGMTAPDAPASGAPTSYDKLNDLSSVKQLKSADSLVEKLHQIKRARMRMDREWKLNVSFYRGNQWVWFNKFNGRVETLPSTDTGELPRWRVRLTSNQILPGVQAYLALLTKTKPVITATPDSGSDRDLKAAQMAEALFEHWWYDLNLKAKLQEALLWSILTSAGYWLIRWDPQAGKSMTFMVGPDGNPILNQELADIYRNQLQQEAQSAGIDPQALIQRYQKTYYMGDLDVCVRGEPHVFRDPSAVSFEEAEWAIVEEFLSPDEIKARYGVTMQPDSVAPDYEVPLPFTNVASAPEKVVKKVYCGYFRPTATLPKGRYVVFCENPNKILYDGPWPFPFEDLPLVRFAGPRVPGSSVDEALVTHSRPYQKLINAILSKVVEHVYLTIRPQMIAPVGSLRQRLTNEPGAVFEFQPMGGGGQALVPQWREMPNLPPYVFTFLDNIQQRMDRLFNLQMVNQGTPPPNVEAGVAIDLLQEAATDQVAPTIQQIEDSLARAGNLMAKLAKRFYTEPRLLKVIGNGGVSKARQFQNADIDGGFSFHAEAGSGLPRTRAGRQARIQSLAQMGLIQPQQMWKYLDVGDLKGLAQQLATDEEQAEREHEYLKEGRPLNVISLNQVQGAIQQGINPETGQPLQPTDDVQGIITRAALQPKLHENLMTHLFKHAQWMNSADFEALPLEVQQNAFTHYQETLQRLYSIPQLPTPQPVRTTLNLKGTVDPVTAAQILDRSGVPEASPDNLQQEPLDTDVRAYLGGGTKGTGAGSGNTHLDAMQQIQDMQHQQDAHELEQAKAAHEAALAEAKAKLAERQLREPWKGGS